jgi:hypothetical protein
VRNGRHSRIIAIYEKGALFIGIKMYISDVLEYKMPSLSLTAGSVVGFK